MTTYLSMGSVNDNRSPDHPHSKMVAAQAKYARAKTMVSGVRHLLKCARDLNRPHSFEQRGAAEVIGICEELLGALKRGDDPEYVAWLSFRLGASWGQLRTRASI